jgi:hypothetical protein
MNKEVSAEVVFLTFVEFVESTGLETTKILRLIEAGVFSPAGLSEQDWCFGHEAVALVSRVKRLGEALELSLDDEVQLLVYQLVGRILKLEADLERLKRLENSEQSVLVGFE